MDLWSPGEWTATQAAFAAVVAAAAVVALWRAARDSYRTASTRTVAYAVVLVAIAVALGQLSVPVGMAKVAPAQHMVNLIAAVLLGPWWATLVAFVAAVVRNATGTGTLFAFPGGMIGAFLAGVAWRATRRPAMAALGEVVGTGIVAALVSAWVVAPVILGRPVAMAGLLVAFLLSSVGGNALGLAVLSALRRARVVDLDVASGPDLGRPGD